MLYERQSTCVNAKTHILTCIAHSQNITTPLKDKYPDFEVGLKCIIMVF